MAVHLPAHAPARSGDTPGQTTVRLNAGDRANFEGVLEHLRDVRGDPFLSHEAALRLSRAVTRRAIKLGLLPQLQTPPTIT